MALEKALVDENKDSFVGADIAKDALAKLVAGSRDEMLDKVSALYVKEFQTRREISDAEKKLEGMKESLKKTQDKLAKVKAGDLSALFEGNKQPEKAE